MSWRQALIIAVVFGCIAAGIVWWLEDFERKRLTSDWRAFIETWQADAKRD